MSDHDHGINGMEFGDDGELYFQIGGNTNAGVPGPISSREDLDEGYFSAATVVAYLARENFDGFITYDSNGIPITGLDVEVFATGQRNSYDIVLHSNGNLYATGMFKVEMFVVSHYPRLLIPSFVDNGPNNENGKRSLGCNGEEAPDPPMLDKLNLIKKGSYFGHANRLRGKKDPRQCKWRNGEEEESDEAFTAPMVILQPSSNGVIEYDSNHFGGQLRGRLVIARYLGELWTVALSDDGETALSDPVLLDVNGGLDVTMAPDGTLFVAKNGEKKVIYIEPLELENPNLVVKSVFPRRGLQAGGTRLHIYGKHLNEFGTPTVRVGGLDCPLNGPITNRKLTCILPSGNGAADIVVTANNGQTSTFERGYRYITAGLPPTVAVSPLPTISYIGRFVLVDATTNQDVAGGLDCTPIACTGSATYLNIRAETSGPVDSVIMTLSGPKEYDNRDYTAPYTIFGDLNNDYVGSMLPAGDYTITAQIFDKDGNAVGPSRSLDFSISNVIARRALRSR